MPSSVLLGHCKLSSAPKKEIYSSVNLRKMIKDTGSGIDIAIKYDTDICPYYIYQFSLPLI